MTTNGKANDESRGQSGRPDPARIAADLRSRLKHSEVVDERSELQTYGYDASFLTQLNPIPPDVVVIARSTEDVVAVMRYADEHAIPVTPRGAASGQTAASVAVEGGIVLAMNAMDRVLEVDLPNMQVICEPGVVHAKLNEQLANASPDLPAGPGLHPDGDGRRNGLDERPRHARRQVRADQRLGARPRSGDAERRDHRDRLGGLASEAVLGRAGADEADRRGRGRPRASSRSSASS